jgi:hypothetical protein
LNEKTVTDAHVVLQIVSPELSVARLIELSGFAPTSKGEKGSRARPQSAPRPANYISYSTEKLSEVRDLNVHLSILRNNVPFEDFARRFLGTDVQVFLTVYWWTTEDVKFCLSADSLTVLSQIGVETEFNLMVDPSPLSHD